MALRATFQEVIQAVRSEAKLSTNTSRGIDHLDMIKQKIRRHYAMLAEDYDWQHLVLKKDSSIARKLLQAGSRYYNFPAALNVQKITKAWVKWGSVWLPLTYGIGFDEYSAFNSDDSTVRSDPVSRWQFYGGDQFEIWPLPSTNGVADGANEVAFEGQKTVEALTEDNSRLDMDDILVTLFAAAEILAASDKTGAVLLSNAAEARLGKLRGNMASKKRYAMGVGQISESGHATYPRHPRYIR